MPTNTKYKALCTTQDCQGIQTNFGTKENAQAKKEEHLKSFPAHIVEILVKLSSGKIKTLKNQ